MNNVRVEALDRLRNLRVLQEAPKKWSAVLCSNKAVDLEPTPKRQPGMVSEALGLSADPPTRTARAGIELTRSPALPPDAEAG